MNEDEQIEELSQEDIAALKEKAARAEILEKEKGELEGKYKELEEDIGTKDWRKARRKIEALEEALNKDGKMIDEETLEVKGKEKPFSPEDIDKRAEAAAERLLINKTLNKAKRELSEDDAKIFDKFYEKVTHGEEVTSDNVEDFIDQTWKVAGAKDSKGVAVPRGGAPRVAKASEDFADTEEGKAVLEKMGLPTGETKK